MRYTICRNCGRYRQPEELVSARYCSPECAQKFRACATCGGFFLTSAGHNEQYCSKDCATQYRMSRFLDTTTTKLLAEELI